MKLTTIIHNYLTSGFKNTKDNSYFLQRVRFVNSFSLLGILTLTIFGFINITTGKSFTGFFEIVFASILTANLFNLRISRNFAFASWIMMISVGIPLILLLFTGGIANTGIFWFFTYPVTGFFLMGRRKGIIWLGGLLFILIFLIILQPLLPRPLVYSPVEIRQLILSLLVVSGVLYFFESIVEINQGLTQKNYQLLQEQLAKKEKTQEQEVIQAKETLKKNKELEDNKVAILSLLEDLQEEKTKSDEERSKLQTLIENLPVGVSVAEVPSGKLTMINKAALSMLGRGIDPNGTKEDYGEIYDVLKPDGTAYPTEEMAPVIAIKTGKLVMKDNIVIRQPDGMLVNVRAISTPVKNNQGKMTTILSILVDITQEKKLERLKDEFLSVASHELRTPLTAIKGIVSMIQSGDYGKLSDNLKEPLKDVFTSSERLIHLVNDLLSISRIQAGRQKYTLTEFTLEKPVQETVALIQPLAKTKHITIKIESLSTIPVQADQDKVKQILNNLIGNAFKFTDKGSITISAKNDDTSMKIYVKDTGIGISKEDQQKLFGKFQQLNSGADRLAGTGLGLYLSLQLAQQMGGNLWLEKSKKGEGSTFIFSLPLAKSPLAKKVKERIKKEKSKVNY